MQSKYRSEHKKEEDIEGECDKIKDLKEFRVDNEEEEKKMKWMKNNLFL